MLKDTTVRARISSNLKHDTEHIFNKLGLSMSEAINLFLAQVKLRKGLPFNVNIPNKETAEAIAEARQGIGVKEIENLDTYFKDLGVDVKNIQKK